MGGRGYKKDMAAWADAFLPCGKIGRIQVSNSGVRFPDREWLSAGAGESLWADPVVGSQGFFREEADVNIVFCCDLFSPLQFQMEVERV